MKKKKNNSVNKIGMEEDEVHEDEVGQATQTLSALSVASMDTIQMTITQTSALVAIRSGILQRPKSGKEETINLVEEVEEEATLLIIEHSLGGEHKQLENSIK